MKAFFTRKLFRAIPIWMVLVLVAVVGVGAWALLSTYGNGTVTTQGANEANLTGVAVNPASSGATCAGSLIDSKTFSIVITNATPSLNCQYDLSWQFSGNNIGNTYIEMPTLDAGAPAWLKVDTSTCSTAGSAPGATNVGRTLKITADPLTIVPGSPVLPFVVEYGISDVPIVCP